MLQQLKERAIRVLAVILAAVLLCSAGCSTKHYSVEDITARCGWENYSERDFKIGSVSTHNIWFSGQKNTDYDYMDFYICDSPAAAKTAFNYIRKNWFSSIYDEGRNYVEGDEADVMDAYVDIFVYVSGNIIVTAEMKVVSAFTYESGEYSKWDDKDYQQRIRSELINNW